ncbi:hypothetical protein [Enterococcus termitis]|uniref:Phage tail protein n=1 Tax=Enterococcus termitis TaxID=332950 RepID=A0A1E5GV30_9ENTE|nr:hypothetical protein [Enterococcus termitis]OEG16180.1 hypothetical protein BCR25_18470 [Enterococcus termitis]OJG96799.1 prophage pi2 protein 43 [Enterococcus termitis]
MTIMQDGTFWLNGRHSKEIHSYIRTRPKKTKAKRVVELKEAAGVNKLIPVDKEYYTNATLSLSCFYLAKNNFDIAVLEDIVTEFIDTKGEYVDFIPYYDPDFVYNVINSNEPNFEGHRGTGLGVPFSFDLSVAPFKMMIRGNESQVFNAPFTLENPLRYSSEPYFKIWGQGDITIKINDYELILKGIEEFIEIDCDQEIQEVYKETTAGMINENSKMYSKEFPKFLPGKNEISWTGDVKSLEVKGRWRTKI